MSPGMGMMSEAGARNFPSVDLELQYLGMRT
jgi:hypothetical protein